MMVPTGIWNESENIFWLGNTGMEGGDEDARTKVKDGGLPVHQPMSGSLPCAVQ